MTPPVLTEDQEILRNNNAPVGNLPPEQEANELEDDKDGETDQLLDDACIAIMDAAEKEDEDIRLPLLTIWRRNRFYFDNIQNIFFDMVARDYRTIDSIVDELSKAGVTADIKTVNIYRSFLESIIAVLSVAPPNVDFPPEDAENPDDIETSEAYSRIAEIVSDHNYAGLMLIKALTLLLNSGMIAAFNYWAEDPNLGYSREPKNGREVEKKLYDVRCKNCGELIESVVPEEQVAQYQNAHCPYCETDGPTDLFPQLDYEYEVTEWENTPKGRTKFDIYDPTYVKVSLYARDQSKCGYLVFRYEDNIAKFKSCYQDKEDKIFSEGGDTNLWERWARISPQNYGAYQTNIGTIRQGWFRPWWYWHPSVSKEQREKLQEVYPNGCCVTKIGQELIEHGHGDLDTDWTISFDPRSEFIHAEPAGNAIIPIQDGKNDLFNIGLQTLEYGIPETFANPKTLNFQKYKETRAAPGMVTPAKPPAPDKSIADGFFTLKTATLSNEYIEFDAGLDKLGQFISAAMPGIWGGTLKPGETTATESNESKAAALQRLQLVWKPVDMFWCINMGKCCTRYAKNIREDERYVKKSNGSFINVWVNKSSLQGKIGQIKPELSGALPQSYEQKKAFIMGLVNLAPNSPIIQGLLTHPNNTENLKQIAGFPDFYVPGEHDRNKQWAEFYEMQRGQQVAIDPDVDTHSIHAEVLKNILVSPVGVMLYKTAPENYQLCIEHYKAHVAAQQPQMQMPQQGNNNPKPAPKPAPANNNAPQQVGG